MTTGNEQQEIAREALRDIPAYVGSAIQQEDSELTTGVDLGKVIASVERFWKEKSEEVGGQADEDFESFRTCGHIGRQLEQLLTEPEEDEFGMIRPTGSAVTQAKDRIFRIAEGRLLPVPEDVGTDREGAIRISWRNRGRFLELVFPYETDLRPYIYYSEGPLFDISEDLAVHQLCGWMRWIEGAARPE